MMRTGLSMTKPAIAAAVPVNALRSEITTGMSAPPIGRTIVTPKTSAEPMMARRTRSATIGSSFTVPVALKTSPSVPRSATSPRTTVRIRDPGKRIGFPLMTPWSLPEAMSEPLNVTDPMTTPRTTKSVVETLAPPASPCVMKSSIATRAAAPPPTALKIETSWGIAVIGTVRAVTRPAAPPMRKPTTMIAQARADAPCATSRTPVARTATAIPAAERRLPLRALAGLFMKWRPRMKQAAPASQASQTNG